VGAVTTALVAWQPGSDQWLELLESALRTSAQLSLGVVVAAAAGVPHLVVLPAPTEHAFLLYAYCLTSVECNHTLELILQTCSIRKEYAILPQH
jgi:hypothetical protein